MDNIKRINLIVERLRRDISAVGSDLDLLDTCNGLIPRSKKFYLGTSLVEKVLNIHQDQGKIYAVKYLRYAMAPNMLFFLKDAKCLVDKIVEMDSELPLNTSEEYYLIEIEV